ncbi:hypothetical protein FBR43_14895 [Sphingomonas baiyangensis]|uniref:Oligosaccharide repeat unit polymerase n=2 Tax=Sphingomonas baiyangensis TaxID=2572576 RepID=A0A4U1L4P2_9SPHN|nr:hypothetical protein FBR43_14895 [Sphingomonas baiyangensis]
MLSTASAAAVLVATRRNKGPTWAMAAMWLLCLLPLAVGMISYRFVSPSNLLPDALIAGSILCVAFGALVEHLFRGRYRSAPPDSVRADADFVAMRSLARGLWLIGMTGGACVILDFVVSGGSLLNLTELRDSFVTRETASVFARLGSVLTWACLFCYFFALVFRDRLRPLALLFFMAPIAAYLLGALLSAGRQAAFQVLIFTILGQVIYRLRNPGARSGRALLPVVAGLMIAYMGFIAVARNDNQISDIKAEVLERLFLFDTANWFEALLGLFGGGIRNVMVEAIVYFTSPIALFDRFLDIGLEGISSGAMNFPFVFRQLEPLTGIDVAQMYQWKVAALDAQGVIGVGWTTAISHIIMDFGFAEAGIALVVQGYLGAWAWRRALTGGDLVDCMLAALFTTAAVYLPLLPAFADTNLFLTTLACIAWRLFGPKTLRDAGEAVRI